MNSTIEDDLTAVRASIEVWEKKQEAYDRGEGYTVSATDCPLCWLARKRKPAPELNCKTCAIMEITGLEGCKGTPAIAAIESEFTLPPVAEICFLRGVEAWLKDE